METNDHTTVEVTSIPLCDFDSTHGKAVVDGKTDLGPWANMCQPCFDEHGLGLGLGVGQRLLLRS